jgi:hypothetical protein
MEESAQNSGPVRFLTACYALIFLKNWPVWLGGTLIGVLSVGAFAVARPLGVVAGAREWIDWLFYLAGIYSRHPESPLLSSSSILTFALIWGALISALLSKQFILRVPPPFEVLRSAAGGIFMGVGATMAAGCNVGGFFSATSALSLGGPVMMAGLIIGTFLEVQYYSWELGRFRYKRGEGKPLGGKRAAGSTTRQPLYGVAALVLAAAAFFAYLSNGGRMAGGFTYAQLAGVLVAGLLFGLILHRTRFAFLQAFREPFMSARGAQARGLAVAVIISAIGFAVIKATGLRAEAAYVAPTFWVGSLIGGILFGFGMPFAGGCGSGICWRTSEGSLKVAIALIFLAFTNSFGQALLDSSPAIARVMGSGIFLPDYINYYWSTALIVAIMGLYYWFVTWNERTGALL